MNREATVSDEYAKDLEVTLRNRARLTANKNLLFWYQKLYSEQFCQLGDVSRLVILEIGSGVSPLTRFYPTVQTSDVLELDYLDYVLDCHQIDEFKLIADGSLDAITVTNVLHHLRSPIEFMVKAATKLKPGGVLIATEPYCSAISTLIYKYLHHEPIDFSIEKPELADVKGPLSSANQALVWLIFNQPDWRRQIAEHYQIGGLQPFTAFSYFATGGISRRIPIPHAIYRWLFPICGLSYQHFPRPDTSRLD